MTQSLEPFWSLTRAWQQTKSLRSKRSSPRSVHSLLEALMKGGVAHGVADELCVRLLTHGSRADGQPCRHGHCSRPSSWVYFWQSEPWNSFEVPCVWGAAPASVHALVIHCRGLPQWYAIQSESLSLQSSSVLDLDGTALVGADRDQKRHMLLDDFVARDCVHRRVKLPALIILSLQP